MQTISLLDIANAIEASALSVRNQVETSGKDVFLTASQLSKKVPELTALGDTPLLRCTSYQKDKKSIFSVNPISLHLNDENEVSLFDATLLKEIECEILNYQIFPDILSGIATVKIENVTLDVSIHLDTESVADLGGKGVIEGEGLPPKELLEIYPEIVTKLENFEFHTDIKIIAETGVSRKYQTPLFTVECQGKKYRNVVSNSQMLKGFQTYGEGSTFKIVNSKPTKTGLKLYLQFENDIDFSDL